MNNPIVLNLLCGPGGGKSTTAAHVFSMLKVAGVETEMVREYAKDLVWAGATSVLTHHQIYVFAKQLKRFDDLLLSEDGVAVIVTDSPIILSAVYPEIYKMGLPECYFELVRSQFDRMRNFNVKLKRVKPYHPGGRLQDEAEAKILDEFIHNLDIPWDMEVPGTDEGAQMIFERIMLQLNES